MSKVALKSLVFVGACAWLAVGCSDETTKSPDGGAKDGGSDAAATDAASAGDAAATDAPITADGGGLDGAGAVDATPLTTLQERGRYLMNNVVGCPECHTPRDATGAPMPGKFLSGWECFIKLPNGDCLSSRNLTNHPTGLMNRTDDEIKDMFLNGKRPPATGGGMPTFLNPVMPYYVFHNMDASDADAIVAYLRTVPGVDHSIPQRGMSFDVPAAAPPLDPTAIPLPAAGTADMESAMHGRYLASKIGLCVECHTQHNPPGPGPVLMTSKLFAGGEPFPLGLPFTPVSLNLTNDQATGAVFTWKAEDIVTLLKTGKDPMGKGICPPMPVGPNGGYGGMLNQDALDIAHFIKSLPPVVNPVMRTMCVFPPPAGDGGAPMGDAGAPSDGPMSTLDAGTGG